MNGERMPGIPQYFVPNAQAAADGRQLLVSGQARVRPIAKALNVEYLPLNRGRTTQDQRMSDPESLEHIASRGDRQAFQNLFEKYAPRVKSFMMRQGADPSTADDLAQETLLAVWRKASLYSIDKGSVTTWIFAIARNLRIDRLRKEQTWLELPEGYDQEASTEAQPDDVLAEQERRINMRRALDGLPPDQHEVVLMSFIEGLSHREIADRLELPVGTVKSRIRLAYFKLRNAVGTPDE